MGISKLTITHPEITYESLNGYLLRSSPGRVKLRIAILQGVMDRTPIDQLSRRRRMSRQGIYNLVNRINREGLQGLEDQHLGRPGKLTAEVANDLKEALSRPPMDRGYPQMQWDNPLARRYLKERHGIEIGRAQLVNWLHKMSAPVKLARKKYERTMGRSNVVRIGYHEGKAVRKINRG